MLCGWSMLIDGNATFLMTSHDVALTAVAVPGLLLPPVSSNCVSTQTSPTPGVPGWLMGFNGVSFPYLPSRTALRFTAPMSVCTGTSGYETCQFMDGLVTGL